MASAEGERGILRGLLARATWTAGRAAGHAILQSDNCPFCRGAPDTEPHILWDCPRWDSACRAWMPWVLQGPGHYRCSHCRRQCEAGLQVLRLGRLATGHHTHRSPLILCIGGERGQRRPYHLEMLPRQRGLASGHVPVHGPHNLMPPALLLLLGPGPPLAQLALLLDLRDARLLQHLGQLPGARVGRHLRSAKGCIRREGTSEGGPAAVRQAVGGDRRLPKRLGAVTVRYKCH